MKPSPGCLGIPRILSWLVGLVLVVGLAGCGGNEQVGAEPASSQRMGALAARDIASPSSTEPELALVVTGITKIGETRVSRTVFDYTFTVQLRNEGDSFDNIQLELVSVGTGSTIIDGDVDVGTIAAHADGTPTDTVTIRHDRSFPFEVTSLVWRYNGTPSDPPVVPGASLYSELAGPVVDGLPYTDTLRIVPNDTRNQVIGLSLANETPGGASPQIDLSGLVDWTPNSADFDTNYLSLVAALADGSQSVIKVPVRVTRVRTVATIALSGEGLYSDPLGRYVVKISSNGFQGEVSGNLEISERYDRDGQFSSQYSTTNPMLLVSVLRAPTQPLARDDAPPSNPTRLKLWRAERILSDPDALPAPVIGLPQTTRVDAENPDLPYTLYINGQRVTTAFTGALAVYTTRSDDLGNHTPANRFEPAIVGRIQSNCVRESAYWDLIEPSRKSCEDYAGTPVILVHGYTLGGYGGGIGTWGNLAHELKERGHPVFELRWDTSMRFEEAAGLLVQLARSVSDATARRPFVIAHSFGGVVAHLAIAGEGIVWSAGDGKWVRQNAGTVNRPLFDGVVTLGSPLSGINDQEGKAFPVGRDQDDYTINECGDVTCVQAGASDTGVLFNREGPLREVVKAIDGIGSDRDPLAVGESIVRVREAWKNSDSLLARSNASIHTVVSMRKAPYKDYFPDLKDSTSYKMGDGLISLIGQAVLTTDFSAVDTDTYGDTSAYKMESGLSSVAGLSPSFLGKADIQPWPGDTDTLIHANINGRNYHFARLAAHTGPQAAFSIREGGNPKWKLYPYRVAYYQEDVQVGAGLDGLLYTAKHPLRYVMDKLLKRTSPTPADEPGIALRYFGSVREVGSSVVPEGVVVDITVLDGEGQTIGRPDRIPVVLGQYEYDAAQLIRRAVGAEVNDYSIYKLRLDIGDNNLYIAEHRIHSGWGNTGETKSLPIVELTRIADVEQSLVPVQGAVVSEGGLPVPGATIHMVRGSNLSVAEVTQSADSQVARRLATDGSGRFQATGLLSGEYTVVVSATGFVSRRFTAIAVNGVDFIQLTGLETVPVPSAFVTTGSMKDPRVGHTATRLLDGRVLITGGDSSNNSAPYLNSAEIFNPSEGTFTSTGDMLFRRGSHTATLLSNGKVLITGGFSEYVTDRTLGSAEIFDPATGRFEATGSMNVKRAWHTATLLNDGKVLVAGGFDNQVPVYGTYLKSAEIYDPSTGAFTLVGDMGIPRIWFAATKLSDGSVLVAGGSDGYNKWTGSAEVFNPTTRSFTGVGSLAMPRWITQAALMGDGQVLFPGGNVCCEARTASTEVYSPSTQSFSPTSDMSMARAGASVTRLIDGTVLVAGGGNGPSFFDSAEIYSPQDGTFGDVQDSMVSSRYLHTATLLADGKVLLVGGNGSGNQTLSSAELYVEQSTQGGPFVDEFNAAEIDTAKWTKVLHPTYPGTSATQVGGELRLAVGAWLHTHGKRTFAGSKIVIEGVMGDAEASFLVMDSFDPITGSSAGQIMGSDTTYRGWGLDVQAYARYAIIGPTTAGSITVAEGQNVLVNWTHNPAMLYRRMTIEGDIVTFERGASVDTLTERLSTRMASSIAGRPLTLIVGTGVGPYTPGRFDWIRVTTWP